jgi:hypothetical protein
VRRAAHGLSVVSGHLELPDLRIKYEAADGRDKSRDVELVTEHDACAQLSRARRKRLLALPRRWSRTARDGHRSAGRRTPMDPHHLE